MTLVHRMLAGALFAAIGALAPASAARPQSTVTITLASHHYQPSPIYLAGGVPVRLIFINRAGKTHDFTAPEFFRAARLQRGSAPGGKVQLARSGATIIDLVPTRGRYKVKCSQPFHTMLGMRTTIIVT